LGYEALIHRTKISEDTLRRQNPAKEIRRMSDKRAMQALAVFLSVSMGF
jgi:hypothetical protein